MGLFDSLFSDENASQLALAAGLLGGKGNLGQIVGSSLMQGQAAGQGAAERKRQAEMDALKKQQFQMALDEAMRQKKQADAMDQFRASIPEPSALGGVNFSGGQLGPTPGRAAQVAPTDPMQKLMYGAMKAGALNPLDFIKSQQKDNTPIALKEGEKLLQRGTFKELASNPKTEKPTSDIQNYQFAKSQGFPGTFEQWDLSRKKAGATNVSVSTEKSLLTQVGEGLGKQIDATLANARAAQQSISTAHQLKTAVDSGKMVAGPGASFRVFGLQIGQMLGVGGATGAEVLGNTRRAMQSMAQAELDAAQQMKGQGQITEAERAIIKRAAAGDIDSMTGPEIRLLADAMEKTGRMKIKNHKANVKALSAMPNAGPLMPFYQVEDPPEYQAPGSQVDDLVKKYGGS